MSIDMVSESNKTAFIIDIASESNKTAFITDTKDSNIKYSYEELRCPITHEIFLDPVVCEDGFVYERYAIEDWFKKKSTSPLTNTEITNKNTFPVFYIKKIIDDLLIRNPELKKEQYTLILTHNNNVKEIQNIMTSKKYRELLRYTQYSLNLLFEHKELFNNFMEQCGDLRIYKHIIDNCYDLVDARCVDNWSILHFICTYIKQDSIRHELIRYVINKGVSVNTTTIPKKSTALHMLCYYYGNLKDIQYIIEQKADINSVNNVEYSAIHYLCSRTNYSEESINILKELLSAGCKLDNITDDNYKTHPLYLACISNNVDIVKYLISIQKELSETIINILIKLISNSSNLELIDCILSIDEKNITNKNTFTILKKACVKNNTELFKLLINKGIDIKLDSNEDGYYLIHTACKNNNIEMVRLLIENKVDINANSLDNEKPLHIACRSASGEIVKLLLNNNAQVNVMDYNDRYPINYMVTNISKNTYDKDTILSLISPLSKEDIFKIIKQDMYDE